MKILKDAKGKAQQLGVSVDQLVEACRRSGITAKLFTELLTPSDKVNRELTMFG